LVAFLFFQVEVAMATPIHPLVADLVAKLDDDLREQFEERAAIMEFDAGLSRDHAECLALLDILSRYPTALLGHNRNT
jgi:hypothetical protein